MKYYIHNKSDDRWTEYGDWWELVTAFYVSKVDYCWSTAKSTNSIGHNDNDVTSEWDYRFSRNPEHLLDYEDAIVEEAKNCLTDESFNRHCDNNNRTYAKPVFIYDEYDRTINKREIEDALKDYRPELEKPRRYKRDKRYNTGKKRCWGSIRSTNYNKRYSAQLQEYKDMFPTDARLRNDIDKAGFAWEFEVQTSVCKSWKYQSKRRRQWK